MDLSEVFYHGIREQVKRVVGLLGEERTEAGLTAFVDGASSWSHCFFARALAPERLSNELDVARILGLQREDGTYNLVPVRLVYRTFDSASTMITRDQLRTMLRDMIDEDAQEKIEVPDVGGTLAGANKWLEKASGQDLMSMLKKISFNGVEKTPVKFDGPVCA